MKTLQQQPKVIDAEALWNSAPEPIDAAALWDAPTAKEPGILDKAMGATGLRSLFGASKRVNQVASELAGSAVSGFGQMEEAFGRAGEALFRPPPGEFDSSGQAAAAMGMSHPGLMRQDAESVQQSGEAINPEGRASLAKDYPRVSATAGMAGMALPIIGAAAVAPELGAAVAGGAMMHTQWRKDALAHGATQEQADTAGAIGALFGAAGGKVLERFGPIGRMLRRMPPAETQVLGAIAKDVAAGTATAAGLTVAQHLTAKYWVGYEKDREGLLHDLSVMAPAGAAVSLLGSLLGLAVAPRRPTARSGEPAPLEPAKPGEIAPAQEAAPGEALAPVEAKPVETPEPMAVSEAPLPLQEQPPAQQPTETATPATELPKGEIPASQSAVPKVAKEPEAKQADSGAAPSKLEELTGIKNAAVDAEREKLGLGPAEHGASKTFEGELASAIERSKEDSGAGSNLIDSLDEKPRPISAEEDMTLSVEMVRRKNDLKAARKALDEARASGGDVEAAQERALKASDAFVKAGEVATRVGTEQGQGLAFRKAMLKDDYSLAETERRIRDYKGGEQLTEEESAQVAKVSADFEARETALAEREAAVKEREATAAAKGLLPAIKERAKRNKAARVPSEFRDKLAKDAEVALDYFKNLGTRAHVGLPVDALPHLARYGAHLIAKGATEFEAWSKAIVAEVGERAAPHLKEAWDAARKILHDASTEHLAGRVGERLLAGKDATRYAKKLAEGFVREGIDQIEPLIDAVHGALKKIDPEITREKARDIMTGYGRFKPLTEDAAKRKLQDLVGQGQKLAQIEALEKKQAPKRTGFERVEPSQENRSLRRKVNQLRKEAGIEVQDPARALKTALQSKETALRNRLEDLREELDTGERAVKDIKPSPSSPTTDALETELRQVREQHEAVFGKKGQTDLERAEAAIHATEKDIAENERKIRERDLSMAVGKQGPPTADVAAARARHAELKAHNTALRAELEHMRALVEDQKPSAEEVRLQKQIDDFGKPKPGPRQGPDTEAVGKLRAELKTLREAREATRKAELEKARKTPDQLRLAAAKARAIAEAEKLRGMIARGEFEKKKLKPIEPDAELTDLRVGVEKARAEIVKLREKHRLENRGKLQKTLETIGKIRRGFVLSSPAVLGKLTGAATARVLSTPVEEAVGGVIAKVLPKLAAGAPRHGKGLNFKAEARAATDTFMVGLKHAAQKVKEGSSDYDKLYGDKKHLGSRDWVDFIGSLHGALKEPAVANEFARSFEKRMAWEISQGADPTSDLVKMKVANEAYQDGQRAISQQDSPLSKRVRLLFSVTREKGTGQPTPLSLLGHTLGEILLPIVKVPTNLAHEAYQYSPFSAPEAAARIGHMLVTGVDRMQPAQKDALMRLLKKGALGSAVTLLGYFNADSIGGYYQPGKRKKSDVDFDSVRVLGTDLPSWALHNPLLEMLQLGATIRRVADSRLKQSDTHKQGIGAGTLAAVIGLLNELPVLKEAVDVGHILDPNDRGNAAGRFIGGLAVPQALIFTAKQIDRETDGDLIKRKPHGVLQNIEAGVPGLRTLVPKVKP